MIKLNKLGVVAFVVDILKQVIAGVLSGVILYMLLKDKTTNNKRLQGVVLRAL